MTVEPPSQIAIIGAGPVGLETALYARYLGYEVTVYEQGEVAENVLKWGHVSMFTPCGMNRSPLGVAAIDAQWPDRDLPDDESLITGRNWVDTYLEPLSQTDLVSPFLCTQTTVAHIGRARTLKSDTPGSADRQELPFRLLLRDSQEKQSTATAEIVIDTTGTYGNPNWMGTGGIPAIGEIDCSSRIDYHIPDIRLVEHERFAGKNILLIGAGYSAATSVVALADIAEKDLDTQITWITRPRRHEAERPLPIRTIVDDVLPLRRSLTDTANRLTKDCNQLRYWPNTTVDEVVWNHQDQHLEVTLGGEHARTHRFDRIVANVGYRPDRNIYRELQVHECYSSEGPIKLAASLLAHQGVDCLQPPDHHPELLRNPEPNFFILGSKSYGRGSDFLFQTGLGQIRDLFRMIHGPDELDLYDNVQATEHRL